MVRQTVNVPLAAWSHDLFRPCRYKVAYGGRGSGKTWQVAYALTILAAQSRKIIYCCRQVLKSIHDSAKRFIETAIYRCGLSPWFRISKDHIRCRLTGSEFHFHGLDKQREEIKGWEDVDIVWVEEAHTMPTESWELLRPTIRKPGSEIWFTFNPKHRTDPVWMEFCAGKDHGTIGVQRHFINWFDNPWFTPELEEERQLCLRTESHRYEHIWEGCPDDEGSSRKVIPYALLANCVKAWKQGLAPDVNRYNSELGLDIADRGADSNAYVRRAGPCIVSWHEWKVPTLGQTARLAHNFALENGVFRLNYDVGGIGAAIRSYFFDFKPLKYRTEPVNFGGEVTGPDRRYTRKQTNAQFFMRRNAQLGFTLRLRAMNTQKLMNGEPINPNKCLFINPDPPSNDHPFGPKPTLERFLGQLSQPEWDDSVTGKVMIIKRDDDEPSPDLYDAAILAYARDSHSGIRLN